MLKLCNIGVWGSRRLLRLLLLGWEDLSWIVSEGVLPHVFEALLGQALTGFHMPIFPVVSRLLLLNAQETFT